MFSKEYFIVYATPKSQGLLQKKIENYHLDLYNLFLINPSFRLDEWFHSQKMSNKFGWSY